MDIRSRTRGTRRTRRTVAAFAAAALLSVVPTVAPAGAATDDLASVHVVRYGGADRYATSLLIAEAFADESEEPVETVVMVSGVQWTDAVVAASLAGRFGAPVLMTPPNHLRADALAWLNEVEAERVIVVSADPPDSDPTISAEITNTLREGFSVERVSGNDQYRAGVAAARRLGGAGELARFGPTAIIASGEVFADALVAGPLAARNRLPLLLTPKAGLHPDVAEYLTGADVKRVVLMGGTAALSADVQSGIEALGIVVDRIAGATRFETATMFADYAAQHGGECWADDQVGLARASLPFDSFSAAPLLAQLCAPAVLTDPAEIPGTTAEFLNDARRGQERITLRVFGGDAAVSQDAIDTYLDADQPSEENKTTDTEPQPVQFRRWDRQALIDLPLWAHCPPEPEPQWLVERLNGFDLTWANWDTESVELDGYHVASGWWTDEQLNRWLPGAGVTAEMAYEHATYHPISDTVGLWPVTILPTAHFQDTPRSHPGLRPAMEHRGHNLSSFADMLRATRDGIAGSGAWPDHVRPGLLLTGWVQWRYAQPPTIQEPIAWAFRSLFEARESGCAAEALIAMCASGETPSPLLASDHPIGRVLRSLACGE